MNKNEESNEEIQNIYFYLKILLVIIFTLIFIYYFLKNNICSHNFYIKEKIDPTKFVDGKIIYFCGFVEKNISKLFLSLIKEII